MARAIHGLSAPNRPCHRRLRQSFRGQIRVCAGSVLLAKRGFSPSAIHRALAIYILDCSSLHVGDHGGSVHGICRRGNGLGQFTMRVPCQRRHLTGAPSATLVRILQRLAPIAVISRDRGTKSSLDARVLGGLGPSFILSLATAPHQGDGVLICISTQRLGGRGVIGLPIVICGQRGQRDIVRSTVRLQNDLRRRTGRRRTTKNPCVHPVILFRTRPGVQRSDRAFSGLGRGLVTVNVPRRRVTVGASRISRLKSISLLTPSYSVHCVVAIGTLGRN